LLIWSRQRSVLVDVDFTLDAKETGPTLALEAFERIRASAAVLARLDSAVVDIVLAVFPSETQWAKALVIAFNILALTSVETRVGRAFIHLGSAVGTGPARLADAQGVKVAIDALAVIAAGRRLAKINFSFATFAGEAGGAGATEIVNEIRTVAAQQARRFGAVVHILVAEGALPSSRTGALEAALFERNALGRVGARIFGARIQGAAAVGPGVARPAETSELTLSRLVLTHGAVVTGGGVATRLFVLTLEAGIAWRAGAEVALLLIATRSAIVARLGGAVVDVDFAKASAESGRTVAIGHVSLS
jgi:hypothetical protein